jgi:hypothetical protein
MSVPPDQDEVDPDVVWRKLAEELGLRLLAVLLLAELVKIPLETDHAIPREFAVENVVIDSPLLQLLGGGLDIAVEEATEVQADQLRHVGKLGGDGDEGDLIQTDYLVHD